MFTISGPEWRNLVTEEHSVTFVTRCLDFVRLGRTTLDMTRAENIKDRSFLQIYLLFWHTMTLFIESEKAFSGFFIRASEGFL